MAHATANIAGRQREWAATGSDRRRDDACRERRGEPWRSPIGWKPVQSSGGD